METNNSLPVRFEVGQIYFCRSLRDFNCVWCFLVESRTAKRVTLRPYGVDGSPAYGVRVTVGVKTMACRPEEYCKPLGSYSMAPTLGALNTFAKLKK